MGNQLATAVLKTAKRPPGRFVGATPTLSASRGVTMQSNTEKILLQGYESMLHLLRDIYQNDLILIELIRSGECPPKALLTVAQNARSGLYTVDGLGDNVRAILESTLTR